MEIKIYVTGRIESSFEIYLEDESRDLYTALQHCIGDIRSNARGYFRVYCIVVYVSVPPIVLLLILSQ